MNEEDRKKKENIRRKKNKERIRKKKKIPRVGSSSSQLSTPGWIGGFRLSDRPRRKLSGWVRIRSGLGLLTHGHLMQTHYDKWAANAKPTRAIWVWAVTCRILIFWGSCFFFFHLVLGIMLLYLAL